MMKTMLGGSALILACYGMPSLAACTVTADPLHAFGIYDPWSGLDDTTTSDITVDCTGALLVISVTISLSTGSSPSYAPRKMFKGTDTLEYNLYTDSGHSTVWGDGSPGTSTVGYLLTLPLLGGASRTDRVYGRIPAGLTATIPGNYSDIVTVTVDYFSL